MRAQICRGLVLNAPEIFADHRFQEWLNNDEPKFTWHRGGPSTSGRISSFSSIPA